MADSCGCCNHPGAGFTGSYTSGPAGTAYPSGRRPARRQTFFSRRLHYASAVLHDPTSITLREFTVLVLVLFGLYRGFFAAGRAYDVLARRDVRELCPRHTPVQCLWTGVWLCVYLAYDWGSEVVPWALFAMVVVFFGEEALHAIRTRMRGGVKS